jgi:osmoprotectant transport system permease protein
VRPGRAHPDPLLWVAACFALVVLGMPYARPLFAWAFPAVDPPVWSGASFLSLWLSHAALVAASCLLSILVAVGLGILVTRGWGRDFRTIVNSVAAIGQTVPPVAVLAIAVPMVGYGPLPTLAALAVYGFLPIVENTIAGIESVPPAVREAAEAMGMAPLRLLRAVELPLAAPVILAGIRVSVIINIGTAAIGSTVGAVTLGTPIIDGLVTDKLPYVLQGAIVVGLFAILADMAFERVDRRLRRRAPGA